MPRRTTAWRLAVGAVAGLAAIVFLSATSRADDDAAPSGRRIVAIGDVHGDLDALTRILRHAGLIDDGGRWHGGRTTLVQTGDLTDRGPHVRGVFDLLMALEGQARRAGGRVEVLLGNHEIMNLAGDLRDVGLASYAEFADSRSERRRADAYTRTVRLLARQAGRPGGTSEAPPDRDMWMAAHPPGLIEYVEALAPSGRYGRWLRERSVAVAIDGTVFLHAGLDPDVVEVDLRALNARIRDELAQLDRARSVLASREVILASFTLPEAIAAVDREVAAIQTAMADGKRDARLDDVALVNALNFFTSLGSLWLFDPGGPLWFRGFARWSPEEGLPRVERLLAQFDAERFVVGHTVMRDFRITPRFGGRVWLIDTGMLAAVYKGRPSALELRGAATRPLYVD